MNEVLGYEAMNDVLSPVTGCDAFRPSAIPQVVPKTKP